MILSNFCFGAKAEISLHMVKGLKNGKCLILVLKKCCATFVGRSVAQTQNSFVIGVNFNAILTTTTAGPMTVFEGIIELVPC